MDEKDNEGRGLGQGFGGTSRGMNHCEEVDAMLIIQDFLWIFLTRLYGNWPKTFATMLSCPCRWTLCLQARHFLLMILVLQYFGATLQSKIDHTSIDR